MSDEQEKSPSTKHELLSLQLTNVTCLQRDVITAALAEHADLVERCRMLEAENRALVQDVARLTLKVSERARARAANTTHNGRGRDYPPSRMQVPPSPPKSAPKLRVRAK